MAKQIRIDAVIEIGGYRMEIEASQYNRAAIGQFTSALAPEYDNSGAGVVFGADDFDNTVAVEIPRSHRSRRPARRIPECRRRSAITVAEKALVSGH